MELITFDPVKIGAIVAVVTVVTQLIKTGFERLEEWKSAPEWIRKIAAWWAHSKGPIVISLMVALFAETLPVLIEDGSLSVSELSIIRKAIGIGGLSNVIYWISRRKSPVIGGR